MENNWNIKRFELPENGTIVEVVTKKGICSCEGHQKREVYFDDGIFQGIKNQEWITKWRISVNNDILKDIDLRRSIKPEPCENCVV